MSVFSIGGNPMMMGVGAAAGLIMFTPNLIIFIILQSKIMSTMSHSGIK
jgi:ABC-type glycerol-3-phosphate transport system permease component